MANNPIDTNSFQHFLLIRGAEYEIIEPVNFDKSNFKCEQDNYARDTFYGNENDLLEFYQNYGSQGGTFMNNDGVLITHLPSGLDLLLQENRDNGSESDVKYILKKDGIEFTTGNFDFTTAETDNVTYFKCKVIQNTNQSKIKKREKLNIDLLSTTDLDDNTITSIPTQRMLLKAKPLYGTSEWCNGENRYFIPFIGIWEFSPFQVVKQYGIENTLSFLSTSVEAGTRPDYDSFSLIQAKDDLSNIKIKIELEFLTEGPFPLRKLVIRSGSVSGGTSNVNVLDIQDEIGYYSNTFEFTFPNNVNSGERIEIFFRGIPGGYVNFYKANVTMSATSTAIDSVINAVRWVDLIKQNYKAIGSLPVNASKFDVNGEFYDNFCFSKNLIKQKLTKPFNVKLSDTIESLEEVNADAQINSTEIYIGQYTDFYRNFLNFYKNL